MRQLEAAERGPQARRGGRRHGRRRGRGAAPRSPAHAPSRAAAAARRGISTGAPAPVERRRFINQKIDFDFTGIARHARMSRTEAEPRLNFHDGDRPSLGARRGPDAHRRVLRDRRQGRRRPGADQRRAAGLHHRRPAGQGGRRVARAGAQRPWRAGPRPAAQAHHGQSRAGRPRQGGQPLRSADRARRCWSAWAPCPRMRPRAIWRSASWRWTARSCAVAGVLPAAVAASARELGLICPAACGGEAAWLGSDIEILAAANLLALINHFNGTQVLSAAGARALRRAAAATTPSSPTSRARRPPSARSRSPRPAATTSC